MSIIAIGIMQMEPDKGLFDFGLDFLKPIRRIVTTYEQVESFCLEFEVKEKPEDIFRSCRPVDILTLRCIDCNSGQGG
jgi:hypothetical protein